MAEQVFPAQRRPIGSRLAFRVVAVALQKAAGQVQRQRQVPQFRGDGGQRRVAWRPVRAVFSQQRQTLGRGERAQRVPLHAEGLRPVRAAAGQQHPAAAMRRPPLPQQLRRLAVVEHQQPRQLAEPGGQHQRQLLGLRQGGELRVQRQAVGAAAAGDFAGHAGRIGETDPAHAASEKLAVTVHELGRELGFADAAQTGGRGDLPHRRHRTRLDAGGQRAQVVLPAHEQRIARKPHPGVVWQRRRFRHAVVGHFCQQGQCCGDIRLRHRSGGYRAVVVDGAGELARVADRRILGRQRPGEIPAVVVSADGIGTGRHRISFASCEDRSGFRPRAMLSPPELSRSRAQ
jgi:hypothetical protein